MGFLFDLMYCIGYFIFMIIFMVIAVATAKRRIAWVPYGIGVALQLMVLIGNQKSANMNGINTTMDWIIYLVLLVGTAVLITKRYNKAQEAAYNADLYEEDTEEESV